MINRQRLTGASLAAVALASAFSAIPAMAQSADTDTSAAPAAVPTPVNGGLDEVIVTARKRAEDVQAVPLSVSAISGAALERRGIANVKELTLTVPSLSLISTTSARTSILQIRGIGSSGANPGIEPDVGVYFDGTYQKQAAAVLQTNLLDIEAVEVLRGPQGTLYGRNTPVGAIIVRSRAPSQTPEAMVQAGAGNYDNLYAMGYVGGGLTETLAARFSFYANHRDGYDYNISSRTRVNGADQKGGRFRMQWKPASSFTGDLILFYNYLKNDCCVADNVDPTGPGGIATPAFLAAAQAALGRPYTNLVGKDHVVDTAEAPLERVKSFGASFTGSLSLSDALTLNSISAYSGARIVSPRTAGVMQPILGVAGFDLSAPTDTFSQEFRLSSDARGRFSYQLGTYIFSENAKYDETRRTVQPTRVFADGTTLPAGLFNNFFFRQKTFSASVYGQATLAITDGLKLTGGGRYSHDRKRGSGISMSTPGASANFTSSFPSYSVTDLRFSESKATWLTSLQYTVTPSVMTYATISTGWKSGGFNGRLAPVGAPLTFAAENAKNYEIGIKSTLFDRRLQANISLYKLVVTGFQDSILNPLTGSGFIVGNAGDIRAKGIEADLQARPVPQLLLTVTGAYLSSKFANYSAAPCYGGAVPNGSKPNTCDLNGRRPAFSPRLRGSFGAEFTQPVGASGLQAFARGEVAITGSQTVTATLDPRARQDGYTIVNGRLGIEGRGQRWTVALWAKNLTDAVYYQQALPAANGAFISAGGRTGVSSLVGWTGAPRTFGVESSFKF